jgi:16S rRNA (guanine1516-N2)-methyltransferase
MQSKTENIAIFIQDPSRESDGVVLARQLGLPIICKQELKEHAIVLVITSNRLELHFPQEQFKPIYIDFSKQALSYRHKKSQGRSELLAKAVGIRGAYLPTVIDATAGLGTDAVLLAHLGCQVLMLERSPIICCLLQDALRRAAFAELPWFDHLTLICDDAHHFLVQQIASHAQVDVVYLDPMFPERSKTALVKKEMRVLHRIVGSDRDAQGLFALAKQCATKRIVIKRPLHARTLVEDGPSLVYKAKASRFDVYLLGASGLHLR